MIQFAIIRTLDGQPICMRACDAASFSLRDKNYGIVLLPKFENEVIGNAILASPANENGFHEIPAEQLNMIKSFAAPLFPELYDHDITEGEEWKKG